VKVQVTTQDRTGGISAEIESQERRDAAVRVVRLAGGPVIELDPTYYKRDHRYRVTHLTLRWTRGRLIRAEVSGPVLRQNGTDGRRTRNDSWFISPRTGDWSVRPPAWVMNLIDRYGTVPSWEETGA
jgi:hypothetical protein